MNNIYSDIAKLLYKRGIYNVCISPGLRNTELSLSFIQHGKFNCHSIVDERSAAYFALGMALKTNTPTILICTSGTAVANYFPAIIEASQSRIPLVVITADRPANLLNSGENQTIEQRNIYGNFVRKNIDIPLDNEYDYTLSEIDESLKFVAKKNDIGITPGPIHINMHLDDFKTSQSLGKSKYLSKNLKSKKIILNDTFNWQMLPFEDIFNLYTCKRPLIIIGRLNHKLNKRVITQLSNHLRAPVLVDSLSQMRFNNKSSIALYDHYINNLNVKPDLVIRIGQKPVSKNLCNQIHYWENNNINRMSFSSLLIDKANRFNDDCPTVIPCKYEDFIDVIINSTPGNNNTDFYDYILNLDNKMSSIINNEDRWSELTIAKACLSSMDDNQNLFIGNSMPIRYIDMLGKLNKDIHINTYSNRGASGIDGIISTALGVAQTSKGKNLLLIGDLSFLHDQNSLLIAKQYNIDLTIVIINNNGGGIFSLLPVSKSLNRNIFNEYWTTPQNIDLKKISTAYDVKYSKVDTIGKLETTLKKYKTIPSLKIIDAQIDMKINKKILSELKKRIKKGTA